MYAESSPWSVVAFTILLVTTSVRMSIVHGYAHSVPGSNLQVLARSDHDWSGCGIGAHPAPKCDSREKRVVSEMVLEGSLLKDTVTTDGERLFSTARAARKALRYDSHLHPSRGVKVDWTLYILHCG